MRKPDCINGDKAYVAVETMREISMFSKENGLDSMSLEEINAEIMNGVHSAIKKQKESGPPDLRMGLNARHAKILYFT